MKAFSLFLADLNDGHTHAALTGELAEQSLYTVLLGAP
jgi:hypothetical protein